MTGNSLRFIMVGIAVLVAAIMGTSRIVGSPANERPEERGTVAGFTTYAVPSANFSLAVPQGWRTFTAEEVFGDDAALDEFMRENPDFAPYRAVLSDPSSPMKLIAVDPQVRAGFATNVNVVAQDAPDDLSFEDFARANEAEIRSIAALAAGDLETEVVHLPAGEAQRLTYHGQFSLGGQARSIAIVQYGLVQNGWTYVVTYTTLPEFEDEYRADFERSASSLSIG